MSIASTHPRVAIIFRSAPHRNDETERPTTNFSRWRTRNRLGDDVVDSAMITRYVRDASLTQLLGLEEEACDV